MTRGSNRKDNKSKGKGETILLSKHRDEMDNIKSKYDKMSELNTALVSENSGLLVAIESMKTKVKELEEYVGKDHIPENLIEAQIEYDSMLVQINPACPKFTCNLPGTETADGLPHIYTVHSKPFLYPVYRFNQLQHGKLVIVKE